MDVSFPLFLVSNIFFQAFVDRPYTVNYHFFFFFSWQNEVTISVCDLLRVKELLPRHAPLDVRSLEPNPLKEILKKGNYLEDGRNELL